MPPSTSPTNYTDNLDGTVSDGITGLMWQQVPAPTTMSWSPAASYCSTVLTLGGHDDWRLPTKIELLSIVDYAAESPAINYTYFSAPPGNYWTSTLVAGSSSNVWIVGFYNGSTDVTDKIYYSGGYVRCVR